MIGEDRIERFIKNIKKELSETVHQAPYTQHLPPSTKHQARKPSCAMRGTCYGCRRPAVYKSVMRGLLKSLMTWAILLPLLRGRF